MLRTAWDTRKSSLQAGTPAVGKRQELAEATKQGRETHRHPHKPHDAMLFLAPSQHASIASQMLQKCSQDIFGRLWHVLSRMLLSTGDLSVSIALRCCPAALKYHQGLESTESQRIWSYGCLEKGKRSVIILAALTILFFVLQLFYISNTLSVLLFTLCHCVSHWIFIQKQFFALKSGFRNEKKRPEIWKLLPASNQF